MTTRAQVKAWLFASSAAFSIAWAAGAHAESPSVPRAGLETVKLVTPTISSSSALKLSLTEPTLTLPEKRERRILGLQLPTFIAFGLGGLSAGGALATGVAATRGNDPSTCDARCTDRHVRDKALLVTTGVLTGMAAVGVGVGITLMLRAPKNPSSDVTRPRLGLGISGEKAVAKVGWAFTSF